jgi:multidrug efflux pump subunit AcrA (membrane-fusion protein)
VAWVIGKDLVATRRPVKVGAISGANIEILSGLVAGDRIASAGVSLLRDGMVVRDLGDGLGGTR